MCDESPGAECANSIETLTGIVAEVTRLVRVAVREGDVEKRAALCLDLDRATRSLRRVELAMRGQAKEARERSDREGDAKRATENRRLGDMSMTEYRAEMERQKAARRAEREEADRGGDTEGTDGASGDRGAEATRPREGE